MAPEPAEKILPATVLNRQPAPDITTGMIETKVEIEINNTDQS